MLVLLDTNVAIGMIEPRYGLHATAAAAVRSLRESGHELCVVAQVHYEFWVVATRPTAQNGLGMSAADAGQALAGFSPPWFRLLRDEGAVYDCWRELVTKLGIEGKQAHDARLVAAMQHHEVTHLLTFNTSDFARYSGVTAMDPKSIVAP